jgi:hypothetical protein
MNRRSEVPLPPPTLRALIPRNREHNFFALAEQAPFSAATIGFS